MNPIAQTFIIAEPETGVDAVFLTSLDLYFRSKSSIFGVEVQIRETLNGVPTRRIVPYGSKILQADSVNVSSTASIATSFTFDTPVVLRTNEQYAITVIPLGGDPNYEIWIAELGSNDIENPSLPIYVNNQLGSLFISSNDLNFIPVPSENMKYKLYTAEFTSTSGEVVFTNSNNDFFYVKDVTGEFRTGEQIVISNGFLDIATLTLSVSNTFTNGELVYQSSSGASPNTARGVIYYNSGTTMKLSNVTGSFTNTGNVTIVGATSGKTSTITRAYQNVVVSNASATNVITVPDPEHPEFGNGNIIAIFNTDKNKGLVAQIIANNNTTNTITLSVNVNFSDSDALITRVQADANLNGYLLTYTRTSPDSIFVLDKVSSNSTVNFANTGGKHIIGRDSGSIAKVISLLDLYYDAITGQFTEIVPNMTSSDWYFKGISSSKSIDSAYNRIDQDIAKEFIDQNRLLMSRSNELKTSLAINGTSGERSLKIKSFLSTSNNKISPYIDTIRNAAVFTHNAIFPEYYLSGFVMALSNTTGYYTPGDIVWQSNAIANVTGTVLQSNATLILVANVSSTNAQHVAEFISGSNINCTNATSNGVSFVDASRYYNEADLPLADQSRYISKNVILADGQDSEDLITYLTAYRPQETNLLVYAQVLNAQDPDAISSKAWSRMPESPISIGLQSSLVDRDNYVELSYAMPESIQLVNSGITVNTTSTTINFTGGASVTDIEPGEFVYIRDVSFGINGATIIAGGSNYSTGDTVTLTGTAGYNDSNSTFYVTANSSNAVVALSPINAGNYLTNAVITANTTSNTTGSGTGLTISIAAGDYVQSTKFIVREVVSVPNNSSIIVNSNSAFNSGNAAIGIIPELESQYSAFKYAENDGVLRYVTQADQFYDSYKSFAIKIILVSNSSYIVPRINDMRSIALQI